jgi:hypothetical protein
MAMCEEKTGAQILAIAHNGNLSNGRMFPIIESSVHAMKKLLREPLVHFLLLGGALFGLYAGRLQQKLEFLAEDFAAAAEPTDTELADYLAKHPDQFAQDQGFTFRQVFLNPEKRGDQLEANTTTLLAELKRRGADAEVSTLGDSFLLPGEFTNEPQRGVAAQFGQEFAVELAQLTPGEWSGPIQSGYGAHVIIVTARTEGRLPALDEVREQVKRELLNARRLEANQKFLDNLLRN